MNPFDFDFVIPLKRDDLLENQNPNQYRISEVFKSGELKIKLRECITCLKESGCDFIIEHFTTLYSVLQNFYNLDFKFLQSFYTDVVIEGLQLLNNALCMIFEDDDFHSDLRTKMLNITKMMLYIAVEFLKSFQEKVDKTYSLVIDKKGKKNSKLMKLKEDHNWDWEENERLALNLIKDIVKLPLHRLWDPPITEKEFIQMIEDCCYSILEKPSVTSIKMKLTREIIFEILGVLIKQYNNAISCKVKIVQVMYEFIKSMLKLYEHVVSILAQAVVFFVTNYNCQSLVKELIVEIIEIGNEIDSFGQDSSSSRAFSNFIVEVAMQKPELILPCINLLLHSLNCDPYSMRICVLTVMSEIVIHVLHSNTDELPEDKRKIRDNFLDHLLDHIIDINVFVRSRTLKLWQGMYKQKVVPKNYIIPLLDQARQRLNDKSSNVTKNAIQLIKVMLEENLYGALLDVEAVKQNLHAVKLKLIQTEKENAKPSIFKIWFYSRFEISDYIYQQINDVSSEEKDFEKPIKKNKKLLDENEVENEFLHTLNKKVSSIQAEVFDQCYKNVFENIVDFEKQYLNRLNLLSNKNEKVQYFEWILGNLCKQDILHDFLKNVHNCDDYSELKMLLNEPVQMDDLQDHEFESNKSVVIYCEDFLRFIELMSSAASVISDIMMGRSSPEVFEAIEFFQVAKQFNLSGAEIGFRNMLLLIHSKEPAIKDAVVNAYKTLYLCSSNTDKMKIAEEAVEKLVSLLKTITFEQKVALTSLLQQWVVNNDIGTEFILILWDKYSRKINTNYDDCKAAAILISMYASGKPEVIHTNIELLTKYGLGSENLKNYALVKYTLLMFRTLKDMKKEDGTLMKYEADSELLHNLMSIVEVQFTNYDNYLYIEIAMEAISTIYKLFEKPDSHCGTLLKILDKKLINDTENNKPGLEINCSEELLTRFIMIIGHVAYCQWQYIENDIVEELKRRNIAEIKSTQIINKKKKNQRNSKNQSVTNQKSITENSVSDTCEDENTNVKNEQIAESGRLVCENELLYGDTLLAKFSLLVITICQNPMKYSGDRLRSAASIALSKLMMVSSKFCDQYIQLFVTMLEKTSSPEVKINLILAFGDLMFRYPNIVEPSTNFFYNRLKDESTDVRCTALAVISYLITNEMVKVKGQMSDVALCLVDSNVMIKSRAFKLFCELSTKGNTLYNIMADIISRLSHPDHRTTEQNFQIILKLLMKLIVKDRHLESIVEKLCHRLRGAVDERQCVDLSYCLTLISYTDRSLQKLVDNILCYADKLNYAKVHKHFTNIIIACKKQHKVNKISELVQELENKIDIILTKGIDNLEADFLKPPTKTPMKSSIRTPRTDRSSGLMNRTRRLNMSTAAKQIVLDEESEEE